ncbi:hypothetical protein, variant [Thecamonas trahens ATCC 50062]|uniref:Calmodulin n=1 Tax=Thecamonas trahens ATCC 50062 TaxID=461836 RepID=A0A0L0DEJ5_THETB|nr:hypothetical protein, variant [Thecamonas trahens ATCC 50062]KNC50752.1 hypothetical protein, variant [Thecamonas trahens ATCC 50062]|eukprot:XP_013756822.1 hypothetical protein, variant [Thecamonas trahens ATCC 50062]
MPRKRKAEAEAKDKSSPEKRGKTLGGRRALRSGAGGGGEAAAGGIKSGKGSKAGKKGKVGKAGSGADRPMSEDQKRRAEATNSELELEAIPSAQQAEGARTVKIVSWNINSLKAASRDGRLADYVASEDPDVLALQELKLASEAVANEEAFAATVAAAGLGHFPHAVWVPSANKGQSGVALLSKIPWLNVTTKLEMGGHELESDGRFVAAEFDDFIVVATYTPNAGPKLVRLGRRVDVWDAALGAYLEQLREAAPGKAVVWTGDLNVAPFAIDVANPEKKESQPGFSPAERDSFQAICARAGLVDTYRKLRDTVADDHPLAAVMDAQIYSFYSYRVRGARPRNIGWRLDHFVVSEHALPRVHASIIRPASVVGSDHLPIVLNNLGEWELKQERAFTRWLNAVLACRSLEVTDLARDLADGSILINTLEILMGAPMPKHRKNPTSPMHQRENVALALDVLGKEGVVVSCSVESVRNGDRKMVLGLVWSMIRHFHIRADGVSVSKTLLAWINEELHGYACCPVRNFTTNFQNGMVLCALVHHLNPSLIDYDALDPNDAEGNLKLALQKAHDAFDIPIMFDAADVSHKPDKLSVMTYVEFFRDHTRSREEVRHIFDYYDTDGSNIMDEAEFRQYLVDCGYDVTDEAMTAVMSLLDRDNSGTVTFDEFLSWYTSPNRDEMLETTGDVRRRWGERPELSTAVREKAAAGAAGAAGTGADRSTDTVAETASNGSGIGLASPPASPIKAGSSSRMASPSPARRSRLNSSGHSLNLTNSRLHAALARARSPMAPERERSISSLRGRSRSPSISSLNRSMPDHAAGQIDPATRSRLTQRRGSLPLGAPLRAPPHQPDECRRCKQHEREIAKLRRQLQSSETRIDELASAVDETNAPASTTFALRQSGMVLEPELMRQLDTANSKLASVQAEYDALAKAHKTLEREVTEAQAAHEAEVAEYNDKLAVAANAFNVVKEQWSAQQIEHAAELEERSKLEGKLEKALNKSRAARAELEAQLEATRAEAESAAKNATDALAAETTAREDHNRKIADLSTELKNCQMSQEAAQAELASVREELRSEEQVRSKSEVELRVLREQCDEAKAELAGVLKSASERKERIKQLEAELDASYEERSRLEAKVEELAQVETKLVATVAAQREHGSMQKAVQGDLAAVRQELQRTEQARSQLEVEHRVLREHHESARAKLASTEASAKDQVAELERVREEVGLLCQQLQGKDAEVRVLQSHQAEARAELERMQKSLDERADRVAALEAKLDNSLDDRTELQQQIAELQVQAREAKSRAAAAEARAIELEDEAEATSMALEASTASLEESSQLARTEAESAQRELRELRARIESLEKVRQADAARAEHEAEARLAAERKLEHAKAECEAAEQALADRVARVDVLEARVDASLDERNELQQQIVELKAAVRETGAAKDADAAHVAQLQAAAQAAEAARVRGHDELTRTRAEYKAKLEAAEEAHGRIVARAEREEAARLEAEARLAAAASEHAETQQRLERAEAERRAAEASLEERLARVETLEAKLDTSLDERQSLQDKVAELQSQIREAEKKTLHLEAQQASSEELIAMVKRDRADVVTRLEAEIAALKGRLAEQEHDAAKVQTKMDALEAELTSERQAHAEVANDLRASVSEREAELATRRTECSELQLQLEALQREIAVTEDAAKHAADELDECRAELEAVQLARSTAECKVEELASELRQSLAAAADAKTELAGCRQELADAGEAQKAIAVRLAEAEAELERERAAHAHTLEQQTADVALLESVRAEKTELVRERDVLKLELGTLSEARTRDARVQQGVREDLEQGLAEAQAERATVEATLGKRLAAAEQASEAASRERDEAKAELATVSVLMARETEAHGETKAELAIIAERARELQTEVSSTSEKCEQIARERDVARVELATTTEARERERRVQDVVRKELEEALGKAKARCETLDQERQDLERRAIELEVLAASAANAAAVAEADRDQRVAENEVEVKAVREQLIAEKETEIKAVREQLVAEKESEIKAVREQLVAEREASVQAVHEQLVAEKETEIKAVREQLVAERKAEMKAMREQLVAEKESEIKAVREQVVVEKETDIKVVREQLVAEHRAEHEQLVAEKETEIKAVREQLVAEKESEINAVREQVVVEKETEIKTVREQLVAEKESEINAVREQVVVEKETEIKTVREQLVAEHRAEHKQLVAEKETEIKAVREQLVAEKESEINAVREQVVVEKETEIKTVREQLVAEHRAEHEQLVAEKETEIKAVHEQLVAEKESEINAVREQVVVEKETEIKTVREQLVAEHRAEHEQLVAEKETEIKAVHEQLVAEKESEIKAVREQLVAEHKAAHEQLVAEKESEIKAVREQLVAEKESEIKTVREKLITEHEAAREQLASEKEAQIQALREQLASQTRVTALAEDDLATASRRLETAVRSLDATSARVTKLEAKLDAAHDARSKQQAQIAALQDELQAAEQARIHAEVSASSAAERESVLAEEQTAHRAHVNDALAKAEAKIAELTTQLERGAFLETQLSSTTKAHKSLLAEYEAFKAEHAVYADVQAKLETALRTKNAEWARQYEALMGEHSHLGLKYDAHKVRYMEIKHKYIAARDRIMEAVRTAENRKDAEYAEQVHTALDSVARAEADRAQAQADARRFSGELGDANDTIARLTADLASYRHKAETAHARYETLLAKLIHYEKHVVPELKLEVQAAQVAVVEEAKRKDVNHTYLDKVIHDKHALERQLADAKNTIALFEAHQPASPLARKSRERRPAEESGGPSRGPDGPASLEKPASPKAPSQMTIDTLKTQLRNERAEHAKAKALVLSLQHQLAVAVKHVSAASSSPLAPTPSLPSLKRTRRRVRRTHSAAE